MLTVPAAGSKSAPAGIVKRNLVQLMSLYFFITYVVLVVVYYLPFLTETRHMSSSFSGLVLSCFFLAIMFPGFFLNRIIAMWKGRIVFYSLLFAIAGLVLIAVAPHKTFLIVGSLLAVHRRCLASAVPCRGQPFPLCAERGARDGFGHLRLFQTAYFRTGDEPRILRQGERQLTG